MPRAYIEMILSSKPGQRRWSLAISCGSNVPCRSRGTSISTFPVPVSTVLRPEPLRVLPSAPSPRGWSISAFNARSASARFRSSSRPFGSRAAFGSAPPSSSSSRASEIQGALRRAMGDLLSSHDARPYTEFLTLLEAEQLGQQALARDLSLDVLHQHKAHDTGAEVAGHLPRQGGDDLPTVGGDPAFPAEADHPRRQLKVLDGVGLVALAPRTRRHVHREDALFGRRWRPLAAPSPALLAPRRFPPGPFVRLGRLVHSPRGQPRPLRHLLRFRQFIAKSPNFRLLCRHADQKLDHEPFQLVQ